MAKKFIGIDFETTGLPHNIFAESRLRILNPKDAFQYFGHVDATEFGILDSEMGKVRHYTIDFESLVKPHTVGNARTRLYKGVHTESFSAVGVTKESIWNHLLSPSSKMKGAKAEWYMNSGIADRISDNSRYSVHKVFSEDGRQLWLSQHSLDAQITSGELFRTGNQQSKLEKLIKTKYAHEIDFKRISQGVFSGKGSDSLYGRVNSWLEDASKGKSVVLSAWNPFFDVNFLMSTLVKNGYEQVANDLHKAISSGTIQIEEVEKYWKAIAYKLVEENPSMAATFKIGMNPTAAAATGRPGQLAHTFEEFEHAVPWKAELVSKLLNIDKSSQIHAAGPDVYNEMKLIKKTLVDIIQESGYGGVDELIKADTAGNISKIVEGVAKKNGTSLDEILTGLTKAKKSMDLAHKYPGMFEAGHLAKSRSIMSKWGGLATVLGLAFAATYKMGEGGKIDPFSKGFQFGPNRRKTPSYKSYTEDEPSTGAQVLKNVGFGAVMPIAGMTAYGMYARSKAPNLLGVTPRNTGNYFDAARNNFIYGIRRLESTFPTLRLFRAASLSEFVAGDLQALPGAASRVLSNPRYMVDANDAGKTYNINVVEKGRFRGRYDHGLDYSHMLEASREVMNEAEQAALKEIFEPSKIPDKLAHRQVRIASKKNGGVIVYVENYDNKGIKIARGSSRSFKMDVPLNINIERERLPNLRKAEASIRHGKLAEDFKDYASSIPYLWQQERQVLTGEARKLTRAEYLKNSLATSIVRDRPEWAGAWSAVKSLQYWLELGSKGVGESRNSFFPRLPNNMVNTQAHIRVVGLTGKELSMKSLKYSYGTVSKVFKEFVGVNRMNTFLESPLEVFIGANKLDNVARKLKASDNLFSNLAGKAINVVNRPHLGIATYDLKYGIAEYAFKIGMKRLLPAYLGYQGFQAIDHLLGKATFSPTGRGPLTDGPIKLIEGASLLYSKLSDITGFTYLAKKQEKVAPGSTGLGFAAPAMSGIFAFKAGQLFYKYGPPAVRETFDKMGRVLAKNSVIAGALRKEAYPGALNRGLLEKAAALAVHRPGLAIGLISTLPMLPFLPGLLGSTKSYQERKAEFQGKKDVAIRKYRGWLLSSSPYGGGRPVQFRRHFLNLVQSDYENKGVVWPNYWKRMLHNFTFGLYDRYALEKYHAKSQPVYESSPYGANVPFVGQPIAATIGRLIKPTVRYHEPQDTDGPILTADPYSLSPKITAGTIAAAQSNTMQLAKAIGLKSEGSMGSLYSRWARHYHDLIGFTGFAYEATKDAMTGKHGSDEFTPYAQSAMEMYNPAQQMWGWHLGDITVFGGEFMRRIFPYPMKTWKINDIPNELSGVSWIPQTSDKPNAFKKYEQDLTHGTTFDKTPMGWLYASRKGWEFLFPEVKGKDLEQYPDDVRLEILQSIAPYSGEFARTSRTVMQQALGNKLSLESEQRFYESLDQVRQLKDQMYASDSNYSYTVDTRKVSGTVTAVGSDGSFSMDSMGDKKMRLAGVSMADSDIRASLLLKEKFDSTEELAKRAAEIKQQTTQKMLQALQVGSKIEVDIPDADQIADTGQGIEARLGNLSEELQELGAPMKNTGNLSSYNMQQERAGIMGSLMGKYWSKVTNEDTFWNRKLIAQRDYLNNYLSTQVFNREVKLWSHPIKHILEPFVANTLHRFGFNKIPGFTNERRRNQEYWDVVKYIKYKSLAVQAAQAGDHEAAYKYHTLWRTTMLGADPTDDNNRDEIAALPQNERPYFSRFANEPNPKKRGEIYKYLPRPARRLYSAIWEKKIAETSSDPEVQERWQNLKDTEGWGISSDEENMWKQETGGRVSKADWIRAKYVQDYLAKHPMPGPESMVWSSNVDVDHVELLALRDQGEQIQDYGFFEDKARIAAFDGPANAAALEINSVSGASGRALGQIVSYIAQDDRVARGTALPTQASVSTMTIDDRTDKHDQFVAKKKFRYAELLLELFHFGY